MDSFLFPHAFQPHLKKMNPVCGHKKSPDPHHWIQALPQLYFSSRYPSTLFSGTFMVSLPFSIIKLFPYVPDIRSPSVRVSSSSSTGLLRCAFIPACMLLCTSSSKAFAVSAMIGIVFPQRSARSSHAPPRYPPC